MIYRVTMYQGKWEAHVFHDIETPSGDDIWRVSIRPLGEFQPRIGMTASNERFADLFKGLTTYKNFGTACNEAATLLRKTSSIDQPT